MLAKYATRGLCLAAALILLITFFAAPAGSVRAATCTVTNANDSGAGSLREKIADASCDTIVFDGDFTIHLASQFVIDRSLTIDGAGHTVVISGDSDSNGDGDVRVFFVQAPDPGSITVNIQNLSVEKGSADQGGGLFNEGEEVRLANVTFRDNSAQDGGGVYVNGPLNAENVIFTQNTAVSRGGGMATEVNMTPKLIDVVFDQNSADQGGGLHLWYYCDATLVNVAFTGNRAAGENGQGGGLFVQEYQDVSQEVIANLIFTGNSAAEGGGLYLEHTPVASLDNLTVYDNTAGTGGGIYVGGSSADIYNSILWGNNADNGAQIYIRPEHSLVVKYSDVQGGWVGDGNIDADPLFVDAANGDFHLQASSPAVDAGDWTLLAVDYHDLDGDGINCDENEENCERTPYDYDRNPRISNGQVDMGAYENQPPAADPGGPYTGAAGAAILFDGSGSSDPNADPLSYAWSFGDGGTSSGVAPSHSYAAAGLYDVCLVVNDGRQNSVAGCTKAQVSGAIPWTLLGFYQPVDMNGVWNLVKGGSTVPLKFEVFEGSQELTDVAVVDRFEVRGTTCPGASVPTDDIEFTTTGNTSLRYDATAGQFIQNWKTPKIKNACYTVYMYTVDGQHLAANFKLK